MFSQPIAFSQFSFFKFQILFHLDTGRKTYIRRSEDVLGVFWTSYVLSIYFLCPGGLRRYLPEQKIYSNLFLNYDNHVLFSVSFMVYLSELKRCENGTAQKDEPLQADFFM